MAKSGSLIAVSGGLEIAKLVLRVVFQVGSFKLLRIDKHVQVMGFQVVIGNVIKLGVLTCFSHFARFNELD